MTKARRLRRLLAREAPTLLCGVHDGLSAALAERAGFDALWASGFCISVSKRLADVGLITMSEHLDATREIDRATRLPVVADVDDGYGDAVIVTRVVHEYESAGIAGICMEDSRHPKRCSLFGELDRKLVSAEAFAGKIRAAKATQVHPDFVVIARTEALVADLGVDEALRRARLYAEAGADLVLVHSKERDPARIREFARRWDGRCPLVSVPTKYPQVTVPELYSAGYKMVIFANHGMRAAIGAMDRVFRTLVETRTLESVEHDITPLDEIFHLVGFDRVRAIEARYLGGEPPPGTDAEPPSIVTPPLTESLFARVLLPERHDDDEHVALRCGDIAFTRAQLRVAVEASAVTLQALGVAEGDRVMLVLPNSAEFVVAFFAVSRLGAIVVPVDFLSGPERLDFIARDTLPRLCLHARGRALPEGFEPASHAVHVDTSGAPLIVDPGPTAPRVPLPPLHEIAGDSDAVILFSAGSTGRPKGAILKHRHLLHIARTLVDIVGMDAGHRELILSPMTHSGGWQRVTSTLLAGGTVVVARGPLSVPGLLEDVRDHGIHGFFTAPPMLRALLMSAPERVREALSSLRSVESASAPLAAGELGRLIELLPGVRVLFQYGLTECSRAVILDAKAHPDKLHTVGLPTPGVEIRITGAGGVKLGPGEKGEVLLAAPQRTERYWNRPDLNLERFQGRWLRTGDIGSVDEQGFLTFHGRQDDMINCGGLSFFPAEVEKELGPVDGVVEYIIAGVPDPKGVMEHVPWAFVVPADPGSWSAVGFAARARERLLPHMIPRRIVVLDAIPLIVAGKPDRRRVVAEHGPASGQGE